MKEKTDIEKQKKLITGQNPFQVPDGYFDSFSDRLSDRLSQRSEKTWMTKKSFSLSPNMALPFYGVVLTMIIVGLFLLLRPSESPELLASSEIESTLAIEVYGDLTEDMIVDAMDDELIIETEEEISDEIIEYLIDEEISLNDIIDEL